MSSNEEDFLSDRSIHFPRYSCVQVFSSLFFLRVYLTYFTGKLLIQLLLPEMNF